MKTETPTPDTAKAAANILILDDDKIILDSLAEFLDLEGYRVATANEFDDAVKVLSERPIQVVITDLNMPNVDGLQFLRYVREHYPQIMVMIVTAFGSIESAVEAVKLGAYDYLTKPINDDELRMSLERAIAQQALVAENQALKRQLRGQNQFCEMVGRDRRIQKVFELIEAVAPTSTTVLVTGESGTGKTLVAHAIHQRSPRRDGPFIEVSCGALPESLLESELFGHVKGSFTGAVADKAGRFLAAEGGTIFLDEIDSATAALQVKLLRVLQERQFEPVGSNKTLNADVRVIVATNKNLRKLVAEEKFRQDLYYRVNVVEVSLAPLRDRVSDIPLLADYFLDRFRQVHRKTIRAIRPEALNLLVRYPWPGNVRELENVIERAVVLARGEMIGPEDLPGELAEGPSGGEGINLTDPAGTLEEMLVKAEKQIVRRALDRYDQNRQLTARALGISRTSLFRKMRDLGL